MYYCVCFKNSNRLIFIYLHFFSSSYCLSTSTVVGWILGFDQSVRLVSRSVFEWPGNVEDLGGRREVLMFRLFVFDEVTEE